MWDHPYLFEYIRMVSHSNKKLKKQSIMKIFVKNSVCFYWGEYPIQSVFWSEESEMESLWSKSNIKYGLASAICHISLFNILRLYATHFIGTGNWWGQFILHICHLKWIKLGMGWNYKCVNFIIFIYKIWIYNFI